MTMGMLTAKSMNDDGAIRLACAIAEGRADDYRTAYKRHLEWPSEESRARLRTAERWLRKPPINAADDIIKSLQLQVESGRTIKRGWSA